MSRPRELGRKDVTPRDCSCDSLRLCRCVPSAAVSLCVCPVARARSPPPSFEKSLLYISHSRRLHLATCTGTIGFAGLVEALGGSVAVMRNHGCCRVGASDAPDQLCMLVQAGSAINRLGLSASARASEVDSQNVFSTRVTGPGRGLLHTIILSHWTCSTAMPAMRSTLYDRVPQIPVEHGSMGPKTSVRHAQQLPVVHAKHALQARASRSAGPCQHSRARPKLAQRRPVWRHAPAGGLPGPPQPPARTRGLQKATFLRMVPKRALHSSTRNSFSVSASLLQLLQKVVTTAARSAGGAVN